MVKRHFMKKVLSTAIALTINNGGDNNECYRCQ